MKFGEPHSFRYVMMFITHYSVTAQAPWNAFLCSRVFHLFSGFKKIMVRRTSIYEKIKKHFLNV